MQAKIIKVDYSAIEGAEDTNRLYWLSDKQVQALLTLASTLAWNTRWEGLPIEFDYRLFESETIKTLMSEVNICQLIADCLLDLESPARQALLEVLADNQNPVLPNRLLPFNPSGTLDPSSASTQNLLDGCDLDNIYGLCEQVVDFAHSCIINALEAIALAFNAVEAMAVASSLVPFLAQATEALVFIQETGKEAYEGAFNVELRQSYICDLFCIAQDACALSLSDIVLYHLSRSSAIVPSTFEALLTNLTAILSGTQFVHDITFIFWGLIAQGEQWIGVNSTDFLLRQIASFYNDPNSDWSTLCDDCASVTPFLYIIDFDSGYPNYETSFFSTTGHTVFGGVQGGGNPSNCMVVGRANYQTYANNSAKIRIDLLVPSTVQKVMYDAWTYTDPLTSGVNGYAVRAIFRDSSDAEIITYYGGETGTLGSTWLEDKTLIEDVNILNVRYVEFFIYVTSGAIPRKNTIKVDNIRIEGLQ